MKTTARLITLLAVWVSVSTAGVLADVTIPYWSLPGYWSLSWYWSLSTGLVCTVMLSDLLWVLLLPVPSIARRCGTILALGVPAQVELQLETAGRHADRRPREIRLVLHDHHPPTLEAEGLPATLRLQSGEKASVYYRVIPTERGNFDFGRVAAWMRSPLGLWQRKVRGATQEPIRVYPNFQSLVRYSLVAIKNRVGQIGIHQYPRRGRGLEFHQLREYRFGDASNQINWKATSRRLKLISCEYQEEQDQQIMLLLDCGRRMRARDEMLSHFDLALNAVLLLAHIALRQGDSVGLMTFGGPERHLSPRKGISTVNTLLNSTYDIQPSVYASDLAQALEDCAKRIQKRSLMVLISNLSDQQPQNLLSVTRSLMKRHLVLYASLREEVIDRVVQTKVHDLPSALRLAAAHEFTERRSRELGLLRAEGILCVDTVPSKLAPALANTYLEIKAGRLL